LHQNKNHNANVFRSGMDTRQTPPTSSLYFFNSKDYGDSEKRLCAKESWLMATWLSHAATVLHLELVTKPCTVWARIKPVSW
jgi:hypothetical protein